MSMAWQPRTFRTGGIVDAEDVNDDLRALSRDIKRNADRRYTYCPVVVPLDGMTDADAANTRTIILPVPIDSNGFVVEVVGAEVSLYATAGVTWTVTLDDGTRPVVSIPVVTAGAAVEARGSTDNPLRFTDPKVLTVVFAGGAASTIVRGSLLLYLRIDRFANDGATFPVYDPTLLSAGSSTAGSLLDAELTAAAAEVANDVAAALDIRCECFLVRKQAVGSPVTWSMPSGAGRTALNVKCRQVEAGVATCTVAVTGGSVVLGPGDDTDEFVQSSRTDDPSNTAADTTVTFTPAAATVDLAYCFVWWS